MFWGRSPGSQVEWEDKDWATVKWGSRERDRECFLWSMKKTAQLWKTIAWHCALRWAGDQSWWPQKFLLVSLPGQFLRNPGRHSISLRVQRWRALQGHEVMLALYHPLNYTATAWVLWMTPNSGTWILLRLGCAVGPSCLNMVSF